MFPPSLLAKLFVRGSLKNIESGFEFRLKNIIDSGTITGLGPVTVDETSYQPAQVKIKVGENELCGDQVSRDKPVYARAMVEIRLTVEGARLDPGQHKITLQVFSREAGKLQFSVTEPLSE